MREEEEEEVGLVGFANEKFSTIYRGFLLTAETKLITELKVATWGGEGRINWPAGGINQMCV